AVHRDRPGPAGIDPAAQQAPRRHRRQTHGGSRGGTRASIACRARGGRSRQRRNHLGLQCPRRGGGEDVRRASLRHRPARAGQLPAGPGGRPCCGQRPGRRAAHRTGPDRCRGGRPRPAPRRSDEHGRPRADRRGRVHQHERGQGRHGFERAGAVLQPRAPALVARRFRERNRPPASGASAAAPRGHLRLPLRLPAQLPVDDAGSAGAARGARAVARALARAPDRRACDRACAGPRRRHLRGSGARAGTVRTAPGL
ncbi:MAG: 3-deoxy-manno-octulosonate cytidylyltransferase, partial [uncultured Ramlibacter sp.]